MVKSFIEKHKLLVGRILVVPFCLFVFVFFIWAFYVEPVVLSIATAIVTMVVLGGIGMNLLIEHKHDKEFRIAIEQNKEE